MNFYMVSSFLLQFEEFNLLILKKFNIFNKSISMYNIALGFYHMQSAHDRDNFVKIEWQNIKDGRSFNFNKYNSTVVTHFNATYDYFSIMHYSAHGFSKNGNATIVPLVS